MVSAHTKSSDGLTPLHYAALMGRLDIAKFLVYKSRGVTTLFCDNNGDTPVHYAVHKHDSVTEAKKLDVIRFLTSECNVKSRAKNNDGDTTLHLAARNKYLTIMKYLIEELNYQCNSCNNQGCTPLDIATVYYNQEVVEFLQQHTTSTHSPPSVIHLSALLGHISSIQHYITDLQYDPDLRDSIGRTPLHYGAMGGHRRITHYLVSSNADPLSEDVFHNLPLHYAAALGHLDVVQFLVNIGSPLTARGVWDKTPAEMAAAGGHKNVQDYLKIQLQ